MSKIACGIFIGIVGLLLVIGGVLIGLAYSGYIWSETTVTVDGLKYDILYSSFGSTFEEAMEICKGRNMKVFEPRDAVINGKVMKKIQAETSYETHWINIRREDALKEDWKYASDGSTVEWFNWFTGEPNNWLNSGEKCIVSNYEFSFTWHDVRCEDRSTVICQDDKNPPIAEDITVDHNGKTYTLVPYKSGDFEDVQAICQSKGLSVYEPRDNSTYYAVFQETQKAGMVINYMNMRRKWLENEKKWTPYKYLSDNTELTWKHDFKEDEPNLDYGNGEACLTTFFVPGSEDDWIALRCIRNGQIICQN